MADVVEETLDPTIGEDTIPKWNVVLDPLRDENDGPVEAPKMARTERLIVDEMG